MKENNYRTHQKILGAVVIAYSAMNIFGGLSIIAAMSFVHTFLDEPDLVDLVLLFSRMIGYALLIVSIPALVAGVGLLKEQDWAKPFSLVIGIIYLLFFPVGTMIGIYSIWLSTQPIIKEKAPVLATDLLK